MSRIAPIWMLPTIKINDVDRIYTHLKIEVHIYERV